MTDSGPRDGDAGNEGGGPGVEPGLSRVVNGLAACLGLLVLSPLLLLLIAAVAIEMRGNPFFVQVRVGRAGRPFRLVKLRSMKHRGEAVEGPRVTSAGDARITRLGQVLRRCKLDELPELWNVLRGDMSLVGPRPEVPEFFDSADRRWQRVLGCRPGLTDPVTLRLYREQDMMAAVDGDLEGFYRDHLLPFKLDGYLEYLAGRTWKTDLQVLVATLGSVVGFRRPRAVTVSEVLAYSRGGPETLSRVG